MKRPALFDYAFTSRQKALLLALAAVLIVAFYYVAVVQNVAATKAANADELAELTTQIQVQESLADQRVAMTSELEALGSKKDLPTVGTYDNFRAEFDELNAILAKADSFDVDFATPVATDSLVRRVAQVSFVTGTNDQALAIVEAINGCSCRNQVGDVSLVTSRSRGKDASVVRGSLSVTFFETTEGAASLAGLEVAEAGK